MMNELALGLIVAFAIIALGGASLTAFALYIMNKERSSKNQRSLGHA